MTAEHSSRFFKTGEGEYGEGDRFLGIRVPVIRKYARTYRNVSIPVVKELLRSGFHEERLLAVILLVNKFGSGTDEDRECIYKLYLGNTHYVNSWDIVDVSAHHIVGAFLQERSKAPLFELARSGVLWERRIAMISTLHYIRQNEFDTALAVADLLVSDSEDLIHKAVGWMLREIGKRDLSVEEAFLQTHYRTMPRTMLRYAIERFPEDKRQRYLQGTA